ncbi:hypothetical protein E9232_001133 [Inquilinus ginsengisoli]|uniref:Uncharacterized protein n=1 Tax=Inquilinus ginsengisoli TaxID=363840 RepID=A0ABU1JJ45_9PROT|nr:hypothetical protein [Inquilinus ginsengisoli]MDR6288626.1 hypothetical protein [Inquilinus ginsengisoli]
MARKVTKWPPPEYDPVLADFGRIVFNFNVFEQHMRTILWCILSEDQNDQKHYAINLNMDIRSIVDSIRTYAIEFCDGDKQRSLIHCCDLFFSVKEYRDFYVNHLSGLVTNGTMELYVADAQPRITDYRKRITEADVEWLQQLCYVGSNYSAEVYGFVAEQLGRLSGGDKPRDLPTPVPLPKKLDRQGIIRLKK